ncbi:MAG: hypothetical protein M0Z25_01390 [Nitrospiraceae bacterium]|nr:hypothetical protein [Nitrospiraceae bacterium]
MTEPTIPEELPPPLPPPQAERAPARRRIIAESKIKGLKVLVWTFLFNALTQKKFPFFPEDSILDLLPSGNKNVPEQKTPASS